MARPNKTGIDYFPLDVDFFVDDKVIAIVGEFGIKGEAAVIHLLCAIYRNGYYVEWNETMKNKLDRELPGVSIRLLDEIIDRLVRWGFFDKVLFDSSHILTSRGIQRRYFEAIKRRKADLSLPYLLISKQEPEVTNVVKPGPTKAQPQLVTPKVAPQPMPAIISGNKDNERCKSRFFDESNRSNIEMLMRNLQIKPEEYSKLIKVADIVINEWNITGTSHHDYSDWARHLISLIRIKLQDNNINKKKSQPKPLVNGNYKYDGGFGGQDI